MTDNCPFCGAAQPRRLQVGDVLYGYCEGFFGDNYVDKTVEMISERRDWAVVRFGVWSDRENDVIERHQLIESRPDYDLDYLIKFTEREPDNDY